MADEDITTLASTLLSTTTSASTISPDEMAANMTGDGHLTVIPEFSSSFLQVRLLNFENKCVYAWQNQGKQITLNQKQ